MTHNWKRVGAQQRRCGKEIKCPLQKGDLFMVHRLNTN